MKLLKNIALLTALTTNVAMANSLPSSSEHHQHDHEHHDTLPTTEELEIFETVDELMEKHNSEKMKNLKKNKGKIQKRFNRFNRFNNRVNNYNQREPFLGLPMRYPTFPHQMANRNIAIATVHNGQPVVLFGPQTAMQLGPMVMGFFMQHEYAHHDLGHGRRHTRENSATREANADCRAAQSLKRYGRMDAIQQTVRWFQSQGCHYNPNTPMHMVRDSHPCGTQRANIVQQCSMR